MSIISMQPSDKSNFLCKRFAMLASTYFDNPVTAKSPTAQVPLENLFRVLEMFRNDTFDDENRRGVLALESTDSLLEDIHSEDSWYADIKKAVHDSISVAYRSTSTTEIAAVEELQLALRGLVVEGDKPNPAVATRAKAFFAQLSSAL